MKSNVSIGILSLAVLLAAFVLTSCTKEENENSASAAIPVTTISIEAPLSGATFMSGDTVHVHVQIDSDVDMHGYEVFIINDSAGDTVWTMHEHDHAASYHIEGQWVNDVADHSDMRIKVNAEVDHDGQIVSDEVHFHCHPM